MIYFSSFNFILSVDGGVMVMVGIERSAVWSLKHRFDQSAYRDLGYLATFLPNFIPFSPVAGAR